MVERVGVDHIACAGERGQRAGVRGVAARKEQRGLRALECRELALEGVMFGMVAADEARRASAEPLAREQRGHGCRGARVGREPEVVVGREVEQPRAVGARAMRGVAARHRAEPASKPGRLEHGQFAPELHTEVRGRGGFNLA